jgi:hypothetical protein
MNPFNFGNPVPPNKMVGRWKMANAIVNDLMNANGHSHMVVGGRRIGKSSLLEALQDLLVKHLYQVEQIDWHLVPIFVNLKRLSRESPEGVFGFITKLIYTSFETLQAKKVWDISFGLDLKSTKLHIFVNSQRSECTLDEFSDIVDEVVDVFGRSHRLLRFVLLIDEVESILSKGWTETLFGYLRSLIYEGILRNHIRYVISGSSQVIDVREEGSPLLNMLKIFYLGVLEEKDVLEILSWAGTMPQDIIQAVIQQCGGHPFIAQYIMHYLWENTLSTATPASVLRITNQFTHERFPDLEQWRLALGDAGLLAYKCLAEANTWLSEAEVRECVNQSEIAVSVGLVKLYYHGLATHDGTWSTYRFAGELFRNWFMFTQLSTAKSGNTIEIFYSYSHKDEKMRNKLETYLSVLKRQGLFISWHDRKVNAGEEWKKEIDTHLKTSHIILLLVSPDFIASDYCYSVEVDQAMRMHAEGKAHVIPVILRPVNWHETMFGKLQALPADGIPITSRNWRNQDEAFFAVAEGIQQVVKKLFLTF